MQTPLISVIVPVYKVEKYLPKCVDSILAQTYRNLEIILVDDGSPDGCPAICDAYAEKDHRVLVIHKENGGLSDARNAALDRISGDFVTFVDSDDFVGKKYVEGLFQALSETESDLSVCDFSIVEKDCLVPDPAIPDVSRLKVFSPAKALEAILYQREFDTSAWGKLYRSSLFREIRFPKGMWYEDLATTYKIIFRTQKIVFTPFKAYFYWQRQGSIINSAFSMKRLELLSTTKETTGEIEKHYPQLRTACIRRLCFSYFNLLRQLVFCSPRMKELEEKLAKETTQHFWTILLDGKTPGRDKAAMLCLAGGVDCFKFFWILYSSLRGFKRRFS